MEPRHLEGSTEENITLTIKAHDPNSEARCDTAIEYAATSPPRECFHKIRGENFTLYDSYISDIDGFVDRLRCC